MRARRAAETTPVEIEAGEDALSTTVAPGTDRRGLATLVRQVAPARPRHRLRLTRVVRRVVGSGGRPDDYDFGEDWDVRTTMMEGRRFGLHPEREADEEAPRRQTFGRPHADALVAPS